MKSEMNTAVVGVSLVMSGAFAYLVYPAGEALGWSLESARVGSLAAFAFFAWQSYSIWRRYFGDEEECDLEKAGLHLLRLGGLFTVCALSIAIGYVACMRRTASELISYLGASTSGAAGYALAFWLAMSKLDPHERGRRMLTAEEVQEEAQDIERRTRRQGGPKLFLAGHWQPWEVALGHVLVMGATKTGKTKLQQMYMNSVLPLVGEKGFDHRAIIFDAATDVLGVLAGMNLQSDIITLSPFDQRGYAWAMYEDIRTRVDCQTFASNLVHIDEHASQKFFDKTVRSLVQEVLWALIRFGGRWTLRDVLLVLRNKERLRAVLSTTPEGQDVWSMAFDNEETGQNIRATINTVTDPLLAVAACWHRAQMEGRTVSLEHWLRHNYILVLPNSHRAKPAVQAINQIMFMQLTQMILDLSEDMNRRCWIFLDEVRQAGRLVSLTDFMVEGRKRGACVCLGFQDIEGMIHVHTLHLARELCGQAHNVLITKLVNPETAELVSKMFGEEDYTEEEVTYSYSLGKRTKTVREVLKKRQAVMPSELMSLPMPSRERGLSFYALLPEFSGGFRHTMTGEAVDAMTPKPNKDPDQDGMPDFEPRPDEHQVLAPFTDMDAARLGIWRIMQQQSQDAKPKPEKGGQQNQDTKQEAQQPSQDAKQKQEEGQKPQPAPQEPTQKPKPAGKKKKPKQGGKLPSDIFRMPRGTDSEPDAGKWIDVSDLSDMRPADGIGFRRRRRS